MPTITIAPVRKILHVNISRAQAFELFTTGIDRWWPHKHHIGSTPMKTAVLERFIGGRWYHICEDGSESNFARVLVWQPPERFMVAWQFNGKWQFDPEISTEVDVYFFAESDKTTRIELEHRHIEKLGEMAETFHGQVDGGWGEILECFGKAADATTKAI